MILKEKEAAIECPVSIMIPCSLCTKAIFVVQCVSNQLRTRKFWHIIFERVPYGEHCTCSSEFPYSIQQDCAFDKSDLGPVLCSVYEQAHSSSNSHMNLEAGSKKRRGREPPTLPTAQEHDVMSLAHGPQGRSTHHTFFPWVFGLA